MGPALIVEAEVPVQRLLGMPCLST